LGVELVDFELAVDFALPLAVARCFLLELVEG
jgi:hypothetical protein